VASAGFIQPGRPCPDAAVAVAAARGFDLSTHRSHLLATPDVSGADLILVMSSAQKWAIRALFGRSSHDVVVLGDLDPEAIEAREVRDPVEQPEEIFALSYSRIDRCIGEFIRATAGRTQPVTFSARQEQTA
jgi:protein-tyrosine-phosphatase